MNRMLVCLVQRIREDLLSPINAWRIWLARFKETFGRNSGRTLSPITPLSNQMAIEEAAQLMHCGYDVLTFVVHVDMSGAGNQK